MRAMRLLFVAFFFTSVVHSAPLTGRNLGGVLDDLSGMTDEGTVSDAVSPQSSSPSSLKATNEPVLMPAHVRLITYTSCIMSVPVN